MRAMPLVLNSKMMVPTHTSPARSLALRVLCLMTPRRSGRARRADQMARVIGEGRANADKIRRPEQVVQTDQLGAYRRRGVAVDVGIVRDEPEPERPGEPADLTPDVAEADDAEHAVHDAHAHM